MARQHHELDNLWLRARAGGQDIPPGDPRWLTIPRLPIPTDDEALRGAKKLLRSVGVRIDAYDWKVTHGRRYTYGRRGTIYVNPDHGWQEIVHLLSHWHFQKKYGGAFKPHDRRHATIERRMIETVIARGWLTGALNRPDPVEAPKPTRQEARLATIARKVELRDEWIRKRDRAVRAIARYDRSINALKRHATTEDCK